VAALRAATRGAQLVTLSDLEYAREKILMGPERLSAIISDEAKKITAYHEVCWRALGTGLLFGRRELHPACVFKYSRRV
jgi:ATP-dependent Zn protease